MPGRMTGSTVTRVAAATTSTPLLAGTSGEAAYVYNDSDQALLLKFGAAAAADSFTCKVMPGGFYEFPLPLYRGPVCGIWPAANGAALVTEVG